MSDEIKKLADIIKNSNNIVFFGGAGISTESNIPDFRSEIGLFSTNFGKYSPEQILSYSFYKKHPKEFFEFYKEKMIYKDALPNKAHITLSKLEEMGKLKAVITQNIDGLHQMAGSKNVLELHGSVLDNYCENCQKEYSLEYILDFKEVIPRCNICQGIVRPRVTMYEESLDMSIFNDAIKYIKNCEVLIVGGTSLAVYPANSLVDYYTKDKLILINKSSTPYDKKANLIINDSIGKALYEALN